MEQKLATIGRTHPGAVASRKTGMCILSVAQSLRDKAGASMTWLVRESSLGVEGTARSSLSKLHQPKI